MICKEAVHSIKVFDNHLERMSSLTSFYNRCQQLIMRNFIIQLKHNIYNSRMNQNTKWTPEEDDKLFHAVKKYGTQWGLINKEMGNTRSQNALIKRWHSHLKQHQSQQRCEQRAKEEARKNQLAQSRNKQGCQNEEEESDSVKSRDEAKIQKQNHEIIRKIQLIEFEWKYPWCQQEQTRLKKYIVFESIFEWDKLGEHFGISSDQIKARWIKVVYPKIKNSLKIGGAVKWSSSEDSILYGADKSKVSYLDLMYFLPGRTVYSIEARWRRMIKNPDVIDHMAVLNEKNSKRKELLAKINMNMKLEKQTAMDKIYEIQKANFEKQKAQIHKFQLMKRSEKARKQYKL